MSSGVDHDERDRADMQRLSAGHEGALTDLMDRHGERLYHYLLRSLQNETEAADLAEETFVRVYQNRGRYDPRQRFSTWIYAIASNLVRDRYRWRSRHPEVPIEPPLGSSDCLGTVSDGRPTPGQDLERAERASLVRHAIGALPEDLKTALILSEYEGLAHAEIAQVLDCSSKAVEMRLYRARQLLREQLADWVGSMQARWPLGQRFDRSQLKDRSQSGLAGR